MSKEAMKLALEALETERPYLGPMPTKTSKAITALREALAEQPAQQQELKAAEAVGYSIGFGEGYQAGKDAAPQPAQQQEPVECQYGKGGFACCEGGPCKADEQNNAPQPAQRKPLTDEQMADFLGCRYHTMSQSDLEFFRLGEAAHGIKEQS